ncbi:uncharacterized protein LOC111684061 isoform X2 [Lucilia cuprina]|uniref:uncharacterized protein LOC111684061 isoform X2 n=1 Tax=Lucilia cuprina TaxID=7375 RepID=UPI001F066C6A|nr:uncharacterized protein LOC111684061 isoform X2 [Lucilia cuprina]
MLCQKMSSLTMKLKAKQQKCCLQRRNRQFTNILMLSIIWTMLFTQTMARPNLETLLSSKPTNDVVQEEQQQEDLFLNEIMTNTNGEKLFNKLKRYHHNQPNYLNKWPGLRDLVLTLDYNDNNGLEESNEFFNTKFFERLRQLASTNSDSYDEDVREENTNLMPLKGLKSSTALMSANQLTFKDHNIKKNVQYMSPCHFKICNMGRKRNARLFTNNY